MNFDTGNFLRLLDDPIAGMEKLAPYVFATHIKDLKIEPSANPTDWFFFAGVPVEWASLTTRNWPKSSTRTAIKGFLAVEIDSSAQ